MTRCVLDIGTLESAVNETVCQFGSPRDFDIFLWRQAADWTGCNWDALVEPVKDRATNESATNELNWAQLVPQLRGLFNLSDLEAVATVRVEMTNVLECNGVREEISISELDLRLEEQIAQHGSIKEFRFSVWRETGDPTGCNWNARIDRIAGDSPKDSAWWDVVPQLRERFNLS